MSGYSELIDQYWKKGETRQLMMLARDINRLLVKSWERSDKLIKIAEELNARCEAQEKALREISAVAWTAEQVEESQRFLTNTQKFLEKIGRILFPEEMPVPATKICSLTIHQQLMKYCGRLEVGGVFQRADLPCDCDDKYKSAWLKWAFSQKYLIKVAGKKYATTPLFHQHLQHFRQQQGNDQTTKTQRTRQ